MLQLTLKDGSTVTFPFGQDSSLSVWTPDGVNGEKRGSWGEIVGLELVPDADPAPVAPVVDPVPVDVEPVAVPASEPVASVPAEDSPPVEPAAVIDDPTPVETAPEPNDSPTNSDGSTPDASTSSDVPEHDTAVTEANDAIVQVALGTSDPDALAKALADVEAALAIYPDSAELADAKTQLTELTSTAPAE